MRTRLRRPYPVNAIPPPDVRKRAVDPYWSSSSIADLSRCPLRRSAHTATLLLSADARQSLQLTELWILSW